MTSSPTPEPHIKACLFDAYGTLFDIASAIRRHESALGEKSELIARTWRSKQLEYAWVHSLKGSFIDFWTCTEQALDYALVLYGADLKLRGAMLDSLRAPPRFPDAAPALLRLRAMGMKTAVLSNGTEAMLKAALSSAGLAPLFDACISIEAARVYKPAPAAYELATRHFGLDRSTIGFVSSNGWDVVGAADYGFRSIWVNRDSTPDEYELQSTVPQAAGLAAAAHFMEEAAR